MICLIVAEAAIFIILSLPTSLRAKAQRPTPAEVLKLPVLEPCVCCQQSHVHSRDCFREKRGAVECPVAALTVCWAASFSPAPRWMHELIYKYGLTIRTNLFAQPSIAVGLHASHVIVAGHVGWPCSSQWASLNGATAHRLTSSRIIGISWTRCGGGLIVVYGLEEGE